ncbi:hypothetical protein GCM10018781_02850 [Kitasatospora indigofera]|uniref:Uncharacterized protein n=1 Tax=Kitasatospora indigofera TaxID=67307 RepID=A0A919FB28_9ACTN|nr:hypothetical protein GCM10018781_02850 [Kitasatospora indigofera]
MPVPEALVERGVGAVKWSQPSRIEVEVRHGQAVTARRIRLLVVGEIAGLDALERGARMEHLVAKAGDKVSDLTGRLGARHVTAGGGVLSKFRATLANRCWLRANGWRVCIPPRGTGEADGLDREARVHDLHGGRQGPRFVVFGRWGGRRIQVWPKLSGSLC